MKSILNKCEQRFADEHKKIVYSYLKRKRLSYDEFYDVIIFGYLRAVANYLNKPELRKYKFSTIAFRAMNTEVSNYYRANNRKKRKHIKVSLDTILFKEGLPLSEIIPDPNEEIDAENVNNQNLLKEMFSYVNPEERKIWELIASGFTYKETALICKISTAVVNNRLHKFRKRLKELFSDIYFS